MTKTANDVAYEAIEPHIHRFHDRNLAIWQLSDPGTDIQGIVNDVLAAFGRAGYQLRHSPTTFHCVVDDCTYECDSYTDQNIHSRQCHVQPNPYKYGTSHRYPGCDRAGDFIWHAVDLT